MSLCTITLGFLSLKPRVVRKSRRLEIKPSWLYHLLYLFCCSNRVVFNRDRRLIQVFRRRWWFIERSETIPYEAVEEVGFVSKNYPQFCGGAPFWGDRYEVVWLALQVRDRKDFVRLFPVEGEGSKETGILGVLLGDSILDFRGDQAEAAYELRTILKEELR